MNYLMAMTAEEWGILIAATITICTGVIFWLTNMAMKLSEISTDLKHVVRLSENTSEELKAIREKLSELEDRVSVLESR